MKKKHSKPHIFVSAIAASAYLFGVSVHGTVTPSTEIDPSRTPVLTWTEFRGEVTEVDRRRSVLRIREKTSEALLEIPVTYNVRIEKRGGTPATLEEVQQGDDVVIRNNEAS